MSDHSLTYHIQNRTEAIIHHSFPALEASLSKESAEKHGIDLHSFAKQLAEQMEMPNRRVTSINFLNISFTIDFEERPL